MEVVGLILLYDHTGDLCSRFWLGIVENLAMDVLVSATYIDDFFKRIFSMELQVAPTHLQALAILASKLTLPPIIPFVGKNAEHTTSGDSRKQRKAQTDLHAGDTTRVVKAKTILLQSVMPI